MVFRDLIDIIFPSEFAVSLPPQDSMAMLTGAASLNSAFVNCRPPRSTVRTHDPRTPVAHCFSGRTSFSLTHFLLLTSSPQILKKDTLLTVQAAMAQLHQHATCLATNTKLETLLLRLPELDNVKAMHEYLKEKLESAWSPNETQTLRIKRLIRDMIVSKDRYSWKGLSGEVMVSLVVVSLCMSTHVCRLTALITDGTPGQLQVIHPGECLCPKRYGAAPEGPQEVCHSVDVLDTLQVVARSAFLIVWFLRGFTDSVFPGLCQCYGRHIKVTIGVHLSRRPAIPGRRHSCRWETGCCVWEEDSSHGESFSCSGIRHSTHERLTSVCFRDSLLETTRLPFHLRRTRRRRRRRVNCGSEYDDNDDDNDSNHAGGDEENQPIGGKNTASSSTSDRAAKRKRVETVEPPASGTGWMSPQFSGIIVNYKNQAVKLPKIPKTRSYWHVLAYVVEYHKRQFGRKLSNEGWIQ